MGDSSSLTVLAPIATIISSVIGYHGGIRVAKLKASSEPPATIADTLAIAQNNSGEQVKALEAECVRLKMECNTYLSFLLDARTSMVVLVFFEIGMYGLMKLNERNGQAMASNVLLVFPFAFYFFAFCVLYQWTKRKPYKFTLKSDDGQR